MSESGERTGVTSQHPKSAQGAWQRTRGANACNRVYNKASGKKPQLYESDREGGRLLGELHF